MYGEGLDPEECRYETTLWDAKEGVARERPLKNGALNIDPSNKDQRITVRAIFNLPTFNLLTDTRLPARQATPVGKEEVRIGTGEAETVSVFAEASLMPGDQLKGLALVRGDYLTCLLKRGWKARVTSNNDYLLETK